jgi:hypothetical protein
MVGRASFNLTCSPSAPVAIGDAGMIGDPNLTPWTIGLSATDARGLTTTCAERGTGLPVRLVCPGISNPEDFVSLEAVRSPEPN